MTIAISPTGTQEHPDRGPFGRDQADRSVATATMSAPLESLGMRQPTNIVDSLAPGSELALQTENGMSGMGPAQAALLATNPAPPAIRAELIKRAVLIEILSAGPSRKLTLLSAPAGWGKTTLLAQWAVDAREGQRFGWLSLDRSANDPTRFWMNVIAALQKSSPGVAPCACALIKMGADPVHTVLPTLINELAATDHQMALVLDDYHLVENGTVHEQVAFVIERMPQTFRLIIATRSDPQLPLARLRARGELLELRAEQLRFRTDEAAHMLDSVLGLKLSDSQVELLFNRTEGWAAGLYLAGLSLAGRTDTAAIVQNLAGDNRHIADYLIAEVLDGQPPHIRDFLLWTSLLRRLCGGVCDAVLQTSGSAALLETIERENMFVVPLDMSRRWYRYHQLFADLLRTELHRSKPDLVPTLHQRAAAWFAGEGLIDEAMHHLVTAGDMNGAVELIAASWATAFIRGQLSAVSGWLTVLPPETVAADPRLGLAQAWIALHLSEPEDAGRWIEAVQATRADDAADVDNVGAHLVVLRAVHAFKTGDLAAALDAARRAIGLGLDAAPLGGPVAYCVYGAALYFSGNTDDAQGAFRAAVPLAEKVGNHLALSYALGYLAMISAHQGQLCAAEELTRRATGASRDLADEEHYVDMMVSAATAIILDMRGDAAAAAEAADIAVALSRRGAGILEVANALLIRAETLGHLGAPPLARASRDEADALLERCSHGGIATRLLSVAQPRKGMVVNARRPGDTVVEGITSKERAVLGLLATRLSRREIGQRLYVSLNTVKTHQRAVYRKLGVEDRAAAVKRARELGLL